MSHPGFRIFIIGAGFSVPAGLPLASSLFKEIRTKLCGNSNFQRDLEAYRNYRKKCDELKLEEEEINLEEFLSYLDIEHFLGLRGNDTWSSEGNETQLAIKKQIGQIIHKNTPAQDALPEYYYNFAEQLSTTDWVLTFNYDTVLERSLDHIGKPYRLFQDRYEKIGLTHNTVDSSKDEVVILKMHGSVDWFSKREFNERYLIAKKALNEHRPKHDIFNDLDKYEAHSIVDGPRSKGDPLTDIYRIIHADDFYAQDHITETPFLLSPSHAKLVYTMPFLGFWEGMGKGGGYNLGMSVIGFSLPEHDVYVRLGLYKLITNYQQKFWDDKLLNMKKDNVKFIDFHLDKKDQGDYQKRYSFADPDKTSFFWDGFGKKAINFLFSQT